MPNSTTARPRKVFGLGLSKTGTSSLAEALKILGYQTVHNPTDNNTMQSVLHGQVACTATEENDAVCDIIFVRHFRELDYAFPHSQFILTVRDLDSWLLSCQKHWYHRDALLGHLANEDLVDFNVYGTTRFNKRMFTSTYEAHYRAVEEYFLERSRDFLILNICAGKGWEPLCRFLELDQPDVMFPHVAPAPWKRASSSLRSVPFAVTLG